MLSVSSFGESHGVAMGAVLDGVPSGLKVSLADLQRELSRRSPGKSDSVSSRREPDDAHILSGVFEGKTLGSPIAVIVNNQDARSDDYDHLKNRFRPGHADRTTLLKYKIRDHRGGGRSSGRETIARVIAGYFASLIIPRVEVVAFIEKLGPFSFSTPSKDLFSMEKYLKELKRKGESIGGSMRIIVKHCPAGLGEPAFDKLKADMAKGILSIGGCVGFTYGAGLDFITRPGSIISRSHEYFGGMEGGISNGETLSMQAVFKAPSTVGDNALKGRHDPCILPRAIPVVEAMVKFILADHFLRQKAYQS